MRLLDTREKKSPRFIEEEFDTIPGTLDAGDMLIGEKVSSLQWKGYGIEFKLSLSDQQNGDYGIHTEPIERFHDECANKIQPFMIKNPKCDFHAIWWVEREVSDHEKKMWDHYCFQYYVWGHVVHSKKAFLKLLRDIERGDYQRDELFIKRSHDEPTILAKMLRQFPGISSTKAIEVANGFNNCIPNLYKTRYVVDFERMDKLIGLKKKGGPRKLSVDLIHWLETGEML